MTLKIVMILNFITYDCKKQFEKQTKQHIIITFHAKMQVWLCKFQNRKSISLRCKDGSHSNYPRLSCGTEYPAFLQRWGILNMNKWLVKCGFESFSAFHSVLAGGEGDITWRKNGMDVDDDKVTKIDETSSKLIIENAALEDSGTYTCHCDFENGHVDSIETELHIYSMLPTNTEPCCITCCITT